jgi:hypothetical protein
MVMAYAAGFIEWQRNEVERTIEPARGLPPQDVRSVREIAESLGNTVGDGFFQNFWSQLGGTRGDFIKVFCNKGR